ncbi:MAG: DoxX family protein [Longimicrobiales bacterium]
MAHTSGFSGATHAILRVGAGLLFMMHGAQKLLGWFGGVGGDGGTVPLATQIGLAGILELGGGALIVLGLLTRPVALLLAIEMLVAYFQVHLPKSIWPIENQGELALLYFLVFVFLVGNRAGPMSVDAALRRGKRGAAGEIKLTREYRVPEERPALRPRPREREAGD